MLILPRPRCEGQGHPSPTEARGVRWTCWLLTGTGQCQDGRGNEARERESLIFQNTRKVALYSVPHGWRQELLLTSLSHAIALHRLSVRTITLHMKSHLGIRANVRGGLGKAHEVESGGLVWFRRRNVTFFILSQMSQLPRFSYPCFIEA